MSGYGIQYSPEVPVLNHNSITPQYIKSWGYHSGIKYIRLQWVDLVNNIRFRVIPIKYFLKLLASSRPSVCLTKTVLGLVFITMADGFSPAGEYLYIPDLYTLKICAYAPGHASVMGYLEEKEKVMGRDEKQTYQVDLCPRTMLRRIVEDAKKSADVDFLVGFETEFILLKSTDPIAAVNEHGWSISQALPSGSVESKIMEEIAESLERAGIELQMYHAEAAPGQYEVVTGPLAPLEACDALIFTRETIYNTAAKYGLRATLAPRVFGNNCGSGAHAHVSIHSKKLPRLPKSTNTALTSLEASFLSGLLGSLPVLCALTLPTEASYARMLDGVWSGGTYVSWGIDNRETPVRLCPSSSHHFEIRCLDGTANPYVSLAGLLGAGLEGVKTGQELDIQECSDMPASLSEEKRKELGIQVRMPRSLREARDRLAGSEGNLIREVLGDQSMMTYLSVNRTLEKCLEEGTKDEVMKRMIENY